MNVRPSEFSDYYIRLGVKRDVPAEAIKYAYRAKVKQFHPDKNPGKEVEVHNDIIALNEAYSVLSNPKLRKEYDEATTIKGFKEERKRTYKSEIREMKIKRRKEEFESFLDAMNLRFVLYFDRYIINPPDCVDSFLTAFLKLISNDYNFICVQEGDYYELIYNKFPSAQYRKPLATFLETMERRIVNWLMK